tara:strand:- start:60891 stop:61814 length:924 start_codon:yes stop_codon:yes gene_type:complete
MIQHIASLRKGDTVLIISPAKSIEASFVDKGIALLESWGLQVEVGPFALGKHRYFSGTDSERASDLQWALDHPTAKAIICARGGYGTIRIVDSVDYAIFKKNPKWLVGFSDITVLHNKMQGVLNYPSIHGLALVYLDELTDDSDTLVTLRKALFGQNLAIPFSANNLNRFGEVTARVVGGNLAILESLIGTTLDITTDGKILFIEEVSEYAYKIDRMLWALKKAGKLDNLAGLVIGGLTDMKQSQEVFGCEVAELIKAMVSEYAYPVAFGFPAGHQLNNQAIVLGYTYQLAVSKSGSNLKLVEHGRS